MVCNKAQLVDPVLKGYTYDTTGDATKHKSPSIKTTHILFQPFLLREHLFQNLHSSIDQPLIV
jgi:hypothetical protein